MSIRDRLTQKLDWHRAELTPNYEKRQARRRDYDAKYGTCHHGTHPAGDCPGDDQ